MASEVGSEVSSAKLLSPGENAFVMLKALGIWDITLPTSPYQSVKAPLLDLHGEELVGFLWAKPSGVLDSPKTVVLRTFSLSH